MSKRRWLCLVATALAFSPGLRAQTPLGTAFTYHGQLKDQGVPADGLHDFQFTLWDAEVDGNMVAGPVQVNDLDVVSGLFSVPIDFGAGAFNGNASWLEIAVGLPDEALTTLSPRQPITATPYALQTRGMFVDDNMNVGLGTNTPGARLDVGAGDIHLDAGREVVFLDNGQIRSHDDKHSVLFRRDENQLELREYGDIVLSAGATAGDETGSMVVKSSGNVGIGTADPTVQQHIEGSDLSLSAAAFMNEDLAIEDADAVLGLYSDVGGDWGSALSLGEVDAEGNLTDKWSFARRASDAPGGSALRLTYGPDANYAANTTVMHITPSGRVGIGTTDPEAALDLNGELIHRGGALKHLGHDLIIADPNRGDGGRALVHTGDGTNERLEINFANDFNQGTFVHGNLGIGRAPGTKLDIADGDIKVDMDRRLKFDAEDGRMFELGYDSAADTGVITAAGRNLEFNTGWGQQLTLRAGHGGIKFNIQTDAGNDETKMELTSAGDLEVKGDLVVSGAVRGDIGPNNGAPFPRPAFDSGWIDVTGSSHTLEHALGGNPDNYVVDVQFQQWFWFGYSNVGGAWRELSSTQITVVWEDGVYDQMRVRIWVYN